MLPTRSNYPLVAVGIALSRLGIHHTFAAHQTVIFVDGSGVQGVVFGLALDGVRMGDACGAGFGQGGVQFVQDVLAQHLVIELRIALAVEREPSHFADGLAGPGLVAIILGSRRAELHDAVAMPQLIFEFAQVLAQGRTGLTGTVRKHHRVRVEVQDLFPQQLQGLVEAEPGPTGGEAGHEDVQVGRQGLAVVLFGVVHFHTVFCQGTDVPDVVLVAVQELVEGLGLGKFAHLHFVLALTKFAPHGVEHHLGQGATSRIVLHLVVIQVDAFPSGVVVEVLGLAFLGPTVGGPPAGLFFDLQPSVDVLGKEPLSALGKMPHVVDFQYHVASFDGFVQFGGAPGARQRPLCVGVRTLPGLGVQGSVQLVFHAGPAQREGQFVPGAIGQDGMVQAGGRQHGTFGQTKVGMEVHGVRGVDELRVPHGVAGVLVHPRVETGVIVVTDLFPRVGGAMQLHHVGASAKERLARLQRGLEVQGRHVVGHLGLVLQSPVPIAFPHLHHRVPADSQRPDFGLGGAIGVFHGPVQ